jgi:DNA-binding PadR family transcriptional regulator
VFVADTRKLSPLSLAVLSCIAEKPMHPYEISSTMRERGKHASIKLNYGSLYTVVESLAKRGMIEPVETVRDGRRPERTVYRATDLGRDAFAHSLAELLRTPDKEFLKFEAALSLLPGIHPDEATGLLRERLFQLEIQVRTWRSAMELATEAKLPRMFYVETEYYLALLEAERDFVTKLVGEMQAGSLEGMDGWRRFYERLAADPDGDYDADAEVKAGEWGGGSPGTP